MMSCSECILGAARVNYLSVDADGGDSIFISSDLQNDADVL